MTDERLREILERLYGGDGEVYQPVPGRTLTEPTGALAVTEEELAELVVRRFAMGSHRETGKLYGSAQGRTAWQRMIA